MTGSGSFASSAMHGWPPPLLALLDEEAGAPAPPAVLALADAARREAGPAAVAVLFYGSALRERAAAGKLVDLYVIVSDYRTMRAAWPARLLVRAMPPNVYFLEAESAAERVRAKYAVVALDHLERLVAREHANPYFWARLAQPTSILWVASPSERDRLIRVFASSCDTLLAATRPLLGTGATSAAVWQRAFAETYRTELRAEPPERSAAIYAAASGRYDRVFGLLADRPCEAVKPATAARRWRLRRLGGKARSVLRLIKAAFTFAGGADYVAWKIERHSGVRVALTDWQRRHPLLAAPVLFWRLYRAGAFR